jgi:hypothetical protein
MSMMKKYSLKKLVDFQIANSEVLKSIVGGTSEKKVPDSRKKDVTQDEKYYR